MKAGESEKYKPYEDHHAAQAKNYPAFSVNTGATLNSDVTQ